MKRSELFWGLALVVVGALLLLDRVLNVSLWRFVGPLLLIAVGLWVVMGSRRGGGELVAEERVIPLESDGLVTMRIKYGLGEMELDGGAAEGALAEGTFVGGLAVERRMSADGEVVTLNTPRDRFTEVWWPRSWGRDRGFAWKIRLARHAPLMLEVETGLSHAMLNLETLDVRSLALKGGLGAVDMVLPARVAQCRVRVDSGLGAVNLSVPQGVAARIRVESGLASTMVDQQRFPQVGENRFASPDWDEAEYRVEMDLHHGLGSVTVK
jgi:hypothetical protein